MPFPIENKLVIAVASSALFDLTESDCIFREKGETVYRAYQEENLNVPFNKGVAFPFVRRLLSLNEAFPQEQPIEVVLLSKNSPETGERAFRSIQHYGLDICRACFTTGEPNFQYLPAFNAALFLSGNVKDVKAALQAGYAAGRVLPTKYVADDDSDKQLRLAFDFDGVLASDEAEKVYKTSGDINAFYTHEVAHAGQAMQLGPIGALLQKISVFQQLEKERAKQDATYQRILKTSIVTARSAPAHERVIASLKAWGVEVDDAFFLGGIEKARVLNILKPHIFFDDQMTHFEGIENIPAVHIPFGIANIT
ncbi:MAG: 5'-nucleotidase [Paludibacteraceae bacterium]|nr:5'-nucleotidase [Paludibacteraceae bacterium]